MSKTRRRKAPGSMRGVLAANVDGLMRAAYRDNPNRPKTLAEDAGVSLSSIQRLLTKEAGATIDTIEGIAGALGVSPHQLLIPDLDASNPQTAAGATEAERRLYARFRREIQK